MENKRKEVVRGNKNAYIADNTELAYSMMGTSRHRAITSTLPLGEMTLNKSESESVANEIFHRQRLGEDV